MSYQLQSMHNNGDIIQYIMLASGKTLPGLYEDLYQNLYNHAYVDNDYLDYLVENILPLHHGSETIEFNSGFVKYILQKYYLHDKKKLLTDLLNNYKTDYQVIQTLHIEQIDAC